MTELEAVFSAIDAANEADPTATPDGPRALIEGRRASEWLAVLDEDASAALAVAARAHHLRRWELARADYPEGRAGYLKWRRDNKAHQGDSAAAILTEHGWDIATIERVRELLGRTRLRSDAETQTLEDVACLAFLETQYDDMVARTDHEHMVDIVAKTLRKMSQAAIGEAAKISFSESGQQVLADAVASLDEPADA